MFLRKPKRSESQPSAPTPGFALRLRALTVDPTTIGITPTATKPVWAVVMDTAFSDSGGWHCLVTLSDGTTSLYTSAAFGIIGGGSHEAVRKASRDLLDLVNGRLDLFVPATDTELPSAGMVTIRALTLHTQLVVCAAEDDLGNNRQLASPIFQAAHNVIGQLRMAS